MRRIFSVLFLSAITSVTMAATTAATPTINISEGAAVVMDSQAKGDAFLAGNKKLSGVITLPDGLQYKVLVKGSGAKPKETDTVTVNYAGRLINGVEFDSSYKRGEPASFQVNQVIPGWVEALQMMPVGSTWELYIPAKLAYGEQGAPPAIGANETLIFKVELLGIKKS